MKPLTSPFAGVLLLGLAAPTFADPCEGVLREMTYGRVALAQAKDKAGFLKSAQEFANAAQKAPACDQAQFNIGVVYEKAGEFAKAREAFAAYLKLAPGAADAAKVQEKIYELEYLAREGGGTKAAAVPATPVSGWKKLEGVWCVVNFCSNKGRVYDLSVIGDQMRLVMRPRTIRSPSGCRIDESEEYTGDISAAGSIRGTRKAGDKRYEDRCSAGPLPVNQWNYSSAPVTGRLTGQESIIELTWPLYLLSGEFTDNATVRFRRR
ncbi:MAG: tetratricopeptide repeat protein [Sulfuritalea sp.]|nr:tetratricopeptide repeat protein [Sulfuritalea sp.]